MKVLTKPQAGSTQQAHPSAISTSLSALRRESPCGFRLRDVSISIESLALLTACLHLALTVRGLLDLSPLHTYTLLCMSSTFS